MTKQEIIRMIKNSKDQATGKPSFLVHNIGGSYSDPEVVLAVKANGLQADYGDWSDVSQFIPNRPQGNFFWGEDKAQDDNGNQIRVEVADLDTSKLWAFPSMAAFAADELAKGNEGVEGLQEALLEIEPVNYEDYTGQFHAEWIYEGDIEAGLLSR